jgi:hypothetical protein
MNGTAADAGSLVELEAELARQDEELTGAVGALVRSGRGRSLPPAVVLELESLRFSDNRVAVRPEAVILYVGVRA